MPEYNDLPQMNNSQRIAELEAKLVETKQELHAVKMLKCCYQAIIREEQQRMKSPEWDNKWLFWDLHRREALACARYWREMGEESTEAYCIKQAERHEWVRDNPEEVKRRADAALARIKQRMEDNQ